MRRDWNERRRIDLRHPLAGGLRFAFNGREGGGRHLHDSSIYGEHSTSYVTPAWNQTGGRPTVSFAAGGANYGTIASPARFHSQTFTVAARVRTSTLVVNTGSVLWNYSRAASLYYSQLLSVGFGGTGYVVFAWNTGAANRAINSGAQVVSSNADYWIVGTFAASNQKAYVNGAQVASGTYADTISYPASPGPVYVSRYIHNEAFVVPISISELLWFDRALTASDVSAYLADVNDGTTCGLWAEPRRFVPVWVAGGNRRRRVFSGACV